MSWMDSWSRPNKQSATPPPLYLTDAATKYCSTCGRVIGARRSHQKNKVVKYCSDGCRRHRVGPVDKKIDRTILSLLLGEKDSGLERTGAMGKFRKGDKRLVITMDEIEGIVFGRDGMGEAGDGDGEEEKARESGGEGGEVTDGSVTHESEGEEALAEGGVKTVEEEEHSEEKAQDEAAPDTRRQEGQRRADEREKVRRAARRAVVFGFAVDPPETTQGKSKTKGGGDKEQPPEEAPRRKCEAVMNGQVVEPSFAKGNWSVRWRE